MKRPVRLFWLALGLMPWAVSALVTTSDRGRWPADWPKELEPLRAQARTIGVATGLQEDIHEIRFTKYVDFVRAWPLLLQQRATNAPLKIYFTNSPPPVGWSHFLSNAGPVVRLFTPVNGSLPQIPGETLSIPGLMGSSEGPAEYVTRPKGTNATGWVAIDPKLAIPLGTGFIYRARTDLEIVVDGTVIDLSRIPLPKETQVMDERFAKPVLSKEERTALLTEAMQAFQDPTRQHPEVAAASWGPTMKRLQPLRVEDGRGSLHIVLAEAGGMEAGFYVHLPANFHAPWVKNSLKLEWLGDSGNMDVGELFYYQRVQP